MIFKVVKTFTVFTLLKVAAFAQAPKIVIPTALNQKISKIIIDRENKFFYTADDEKIIMWNFKTMTQLYSFTIANISTDAGTATRVTSFKELIISPDGNILACITVKDSLKIFSTATGKFLQAIANVESKIVFSKDSKTIYYIANGPTIANSNEPEGRMVKAVTIANGSVKDYWHLKYLNAFGLSAKYFFPLLNSRIINFNEKGYEILDLDEKKEVANEQISAEAKKNLSEPNMAFNENNFEVYPESGLFVFQQKRKQGLGWATWDIYNNREFAFMPAYAAITMQASTNADKLLYITNKGTRYNKQELVIYSQGYKIQKKKLLDISDEIYVAALSKKNNTVIYVDYNYKLFKANIDNNGKETVQRAMPEINTSSFFREGNLMSFNASTIVSDNINQGTFKMYKSNYVVDLNRSAVYIYDTVPSIPSNVVSSIRLNKDSFLLSYNSITTDKNTFFIYDKKSKKSTAFTVKDFATTHQTISRQFAGLPEFFTLTTPGIAYYTIGQYGVKDTDPYTCNLYKYNLATNKSEKIFSAASMESAKWKSLGGSSAYSPYAVKQLIMDKDNEIFASAENDFKGYVKIIDIKTGKILASHPFMYDSATLRNNYVNIKDFEKEGNDYRPFILKAVKKTSDKIVKVLGSENLYEFNLTNGQATEKKFIDGKMFDGKHEVNIFGDHKLENIIATYQDENETIVETVYGPNRFRLDHISSPVTNIEFTQNDSILYTIHADKSMNAYNAITGKYFGTLYIFENTADWVFVNADGRFDGTDNGIKRLYFLKGREVVNLDKVYEKFYTPNLFTRLVNGEKFDPININIKGTPKVKIAYAEATRNLNVEEDVPSYQNKTGFADIVVTASAEDDGIDEIRLFQNGKIVTLTTRNLIVADDNGGSKTNKYQLSLLPGNNNIRAIALNTQRTESDPDEIIVSYSANGIQPTPKPIQNNGTSIISSIDKNATMYLMVVGINAYTNKINPLAYALPDATAFKEEIEKDAKSVLANVKTYFITDAKADKAGIVTAFNEIKRDAKPQDVFVFYYAGHGYINPVNKEFYLVSVDVADGGESLLKNGIPAKELQQYAVDIQAQKQLFILDACQSAGAFNAMLQHDGEQQKSLAVVARSTGTHWMAASGSTETAKEFGELGHGAFTYVLLQALKGQAAANKMITVNGMKNFLQIQVPELVKKYGGNNQYPASYGFGNDFPVEMLK